MCLSLFFFFFIPSFPSPSALIFLQTPEISCYPRQIIVHWNTCLLSNLFALPLINLNSVLRPSPKAGWFWDLEELLVHLQSPFPAYPKLPGISKSSRREQWNPWRLLLLSHTLFFLGFFFFLKVWDNSYSLPGFDWLSKEAVSYKLPSLLCFCLIISWGPGEYRRGKIPAAIPLPDPWNYLLVIGLNYWGGGNNFDVSG